MNIHSIVCNPFQERCYVLWGESRQAVVIDCGISSPEEQQRLTDIVDRNGLTVVAHLDTHAHLDHLFGAAWLYRTFGVPVFLHSDDLPLTQRLRDQAYAFGFPWDDWDFPVVPLQIQPNGALSNPTLRTSDLPPFRVLHTPGHSPGSVCYLFPSSLFSHPSSLTPQPSPATQVQETPPPSGGRGVPSLFSGDTLFRCGFGRTDLQGGSYAALMNSLQSLQALPPDTRVLPGHGPSTTIGAEQLC